MFHSRVDPGVETKRTPGWDEDRKMGVCVFFFRVWWYHGGGIWFYIVFTNLDYIRYISIQELCMCTCSNLNARSANFKDRFVPTSVQTLDLASPEPLIKRFMTEQNTDTRMMMSWHLMNKLKLKTRQWESTQNYTCSYSQADDLKQKVTNEKK